VTPTAPTATTSSTASATTTPPIAATSTGTAATKKSDTVRVLLNKETWMRIQDSHGKQLFDGIGKAGKDIELTGTPPFKVKVGHTEGIVVEYKGEKTEFKDYPNRNGKSITIGTTASSNNE
jgi:cytoskeleton protein RodZ